MKLNKYFLMLGLAASTVALTTACSDRDEEITHVDYDRLFSPLNLEARVMNQINVRLNWTLVNGAQTYELNVYESQNQEGDDGDASDKTQFVTPPVGAPVVKSFEGINENDLPFTVEGLDGQTRYIFEVIAVHKNGSKSKSNCVEVKTGAEQSFKTVADDEIEATSVTLRWNASETTGCVITLTPGDIKHTITAEESAAKCAVITGLTGETEYTAKMMNGTKERGKITFKTAVDLGDAIAVNPTDNLNDVIAAAPAGSTLALFPGTYECTNDAGDAQVKIIVDKNISIKAVRPADRPIIKGCFHLTNGASLTMSQIIIDGTGSDGSQAFEWKTATNYEDFILDDCEIMNYTKGFFYLNVAAVINNITINNCLIHDIVCSGGDFFDSRKGGYNSFNLTNSTIYRSAKERDVFRYDDASGSLTAASVITVDHCTFSEVGNGAANYRFFYVRFKGNKITFTNNIVADFCNKRGFSEQANTGVPTFGKNYYFNTKNLLEIEDGNTQAIKFFDTAGKALSASPFTDAANADFTVKDEDVAYVGAGDPRWIK